MKIIEEKEFLTNKDKYIILDINNDNILDNIEIDNIYLDEISIPKRKLNKITNIKYNTDYDNPIVLEKDINNNLYINLDYYLNNQDIIDNILCNYLKQCKKEIINIKSIGLINDNIIDSIVSNPNIKKVSLAKYSINPYTLTKEDYIKSKKANIKVDTDLVSEELKEVYDDIIILNSEKYLIDYYKYRHLATLESINITRELSDEELYNLKFINPYLTIIIEMDNYEYINVINNRIKELGYNNSIEIKIRNKKR